MILCFSSHPTQKLPLLHRQKLALRQYSVIITQCLHVEAIFPYLMEKNMLTSRDKQILMNNLTPDDDKIAYLLVILPKKGQDFFGKFMLSICESKDGTGTGHDDIIKALTAKINELNKADIDASNR